VDPGSPHVLAEYRLARQADELGQHVVEEPLVSSAASSMTAVSLPLIASDAVLKAL
jgi:hypothetical protein